MAHQQAQLAAGRWQTLPLVEQLANVGSDVARAHRWQGKDPASCERHGPAPLICSTPGA
jgi:hypothetical protein